MYKLMTTDILFLAYKREEFTKISWSSLWPGLKREDIRGNYPLAFEINADVSRVLYYSDGSTIPSDLNAPLDTQFISDRFGGPIAIMCDYLTRSSNAKYFVKIDNDTVVPPGFLRTCLQFLESYPDIDFLGIEPTPFYSRENMDVRFKKVASYENLLYPPLNRVPEYVDHIGGIGVFRRSAFDCKYCGGAGLQDLDACSICGGTQLNLPVPARDGRFGFTEWQLKNPQVKKAWMNPPLPVFLLDHVPFEPFISLSKKYVSEGLQRQPWGLYPEACHVLWDWWLKSNKL